MANKVPKNLQETIVEDKLALDFLRVFPKLNDTQRDDIRKIIDEA